MKPRKSFKHRITLTLVLCSGVPLLILGFFSIQIIENSSMKSVSNRLEESLVTADSILSDSLGEIRKDFETFSFDENIFNSIKEHDKTKVINLERELVSKYFTLFGNRSKYMNFYLIFEDGSFLGDQHLPDKYDYNTYKNWGIFRESSNKQTSILYPNASQNADDRTSISYAKEIKLSSGEKAYLILDISSEYFQFLMNSVKSTSFGYIQYIITSSNSDIIYNDSMYTSSLNFMNNIFRYDRFDTEKLSNANINPDSVLIESLHNETLKIRYYGLISKSMITDSNQEVIYWITALIALAFTITVIIGIALANSVSKPILSLASSIKEDHDLLDDFDMSKREDEVSQVYKELKSLLLRVQSYHRDDLEKNSLIKEAEIKLLMSQMNPHFLNNTLDSIKWMAKLGDTEDISWMVTELSFLLKESMNTGRTLVSFEEELRFVESYIAIQKFRYGTRFNFIKGIQNEVLNITIPKLILQPLVENALIHGVEKNDEDSIIELNAWVGMGNLFISIADNGAGTDLNINNILSGENSRIGLKNVDKRIKLYYGEEYGIRFDSKKSVGTVVYIEIPIEMRGRNVPYNNM